MDWETFSLVGRTFYQVFPNSLLVEIGENNDYFLIGIKGDEKLDLDNVNKNISYAQRSKNLIINNPEVRITSYNVCYTKLLRAPLRSLKSTSPLPLPRHSLA